DVVAAVERGEARSGDPRRHAHRVVERRRPIADRLQDDGRCRDAWQVVDDVHLLAGDPAGHGVGGRRRHPLEIVEPTHLLLGRVGNEALREDAPEVRALPRPTDPDHAAIRLLFGRLIRRQGDGLAGEGAIEDQLAHTLRGSGRVRDRDKAAATGRAGEGWTTIAREIVRPVANGRVHLKCGRGVYSTLDTYAIGPVEKAPCHSIYG